MRDTCIGDHSRCRARRTRVQPFPPSPVIVVGPGNSLRFDVVHLGDMNDELGD